MQLSRRQLVGCFCRGRPSFENLKSLITFVFVLSFVMVLCVEYFNGGLPSDNTSPAVRMRELQGRETPANNVTTQWTIPTNRMKHFTNPCWNESLREEASLLYRSNFFFKYDCFYRSQFMKALDTVYNLTLDPRRTWRLRCYPHYFVIGAPKSGTTELYDVMLRHPDIVPAARKEPEFWNDRKFGRIMNPVAFQCHGQRIQEGEHASVRDYLDLFDEAAEQIRMRKRSMNGNWVNPAVVGDHTPDTLFDIGDPGDYPQHPVSLTPWRTNADLLWAANPTSRLVVILRNPIDRALSQYKIHEGASTEGFHQHVIEALEVARDCLRNFHYRYCLYRRDVIPMSIRVGMYAGYLRDWLDVFPREQILVVNFDDFADNETKVTNTIFSHIGIDKMPANFFDSRAEGIKNRAISNISMLPETCVLLKRYYFEWNKRLAELLGDDSFIWKDHRCPHEQNS